MDQDGSTGRKVGQAQRRGPEKPEHGMRGSQLVYHFIPEEVNVFPAPFCCRV